VRPLVHPDAAIRATVLPPAVDIMGLFGISAEMSRLGKSVLIGLTDSPFQV